MTEYHVELRENDESGFACFVVGGGGEELIGVFRELKVAEEFALREAYDRVVLPYRRESCDQLVLL